MTCAFCSTEITGEPRPVFSNGQDVPACYPRCDASLRPAPVARASRKCTVCSADTTNAATYREGRCYFCLPEAEKILVAGDPVVRWIGVRS